MSQDIKTSAVQNKSMCGIVMPISSIDGCPESHWVDVLDIISEAIELADFMPNLVSNGDDAGIIHKRIIQNLYDNPVVVCDVSGKNPNVMFELGIRLAFDKPTIIVKDDKTSYSFDTSSIEHLEYPRDLRFSKIVEFKQKLAEKIRATYEKAQNDPGYTTFLKHFGEFKVAKLEKKEVSSQEFIMDELRQIRDSIRKLERGDGQIDLSWPTADSTRSRSRRQLRFNLAGVPPDECGRLMKIAATYDQVMSAALRDDATSGGAILVVQLMANSSMDQVLEIQSVLQALITKAKATS
jgi:hypothetical protein